MNHDIQHCDGIIKTENGSVFCDRKNFCERNRAHQEAKEFGLMVSYDDTKVCVSNEHYNFIHRLDAEKISIKEFWDEINDRRLKGDISYLYLLDKVREHAFVLEVEALQSKIKILKLEEELLIEKAKNCRIESTLKATPN